MIGGTEPNQLLSLTDLGQSVWLDYLDRGLLSSGHLIERIEHDGVRGIDLDARTFATALVGDHAYVGSIDSLARHGDTAEEIYEALVIQDARLAADAFLELHRVLGGRDGYVAVDLDPAIAFDQARTVESARRLWFAIDRPNAMVKIPATAAGVAAVERLVEEGVPVMVTLLYDLARYDRVASAYVQGLEARALRGRDVQVASVASFELGALDAAVDAALESRAPALARTLRGKLGLACARLAYQHWRQRFEGTRFELLAGQGAAPQRLLWSGARPGRSSADELLYIEELVGSHTVEVMAISTLELYRGHGHPVARIEGHLEQAQHALDELARANIDLGAITRDLETSAIQSLAEARARAIDQIERRRDHVVSQFGDD